MESIKHRYKLNKGWTKEKVMKAITTGNFGIKSVKSDGICRYKNHDGNKCFVGCFIPNEIYSESMEGMPVNQLLLEYSSIKSHLPFKDVQHPDSMGGSQNLLAMFQAVHDSYNPTVYPTSLYAQAESFLNNYFEDNP